MMAKYIITSNCRKSKGGVIIKKYINNKTYDTDSAVLICKLPTDGILYETLYRKKSGEFFKHITNGSQEAIVPLTYTEAKKIAKDSMDDRSFAETFGIVSGGTTNLHIIVPSERGMKMKRVAEQRGISLSCLLVEMIDAL